jgi:hypothetical protein
MTRPEYDPFTLIQLKDNCEIEIGAKFNDSEKSFFTQKINRMKQILFLYPFKLVNIDSSTPRYNPNAYLKRQENDLMLFDVILTHRKSGLKRRHFCILVSFNNLTIPRLLLISLLEF